MRVALFVPCYVDQLRPDVGLAALTLLEGWGAEVDFPEQQTCCGQPLLNTGAASEARPLALRFLDIFEGYDHIVVPSASCAATVRRHYGSLLAGTSRVSSFADVTDRVWEVCAFLREVLELDTSAGHYAHRVGLHASCHALRDLRQGGASERMDAPAGNPARELLGPIEGLELVEPSRGDDCCGFGGTFALEEAAVSSLMGEDRLAAHRDAEVIASSDVSCLLHLEAIARRNGDAVEVRHVVEIVAHALTGARA
jgi:L-lactate dehydrogenase complex protein LldE